MKTLTMCVICWSILLFILTACGAPVVEPTGAPVVEPTPRVDGIIFISDHSSLESGQCTFVRWEVMDGFSPS